MHIDSVNMEHSHRNTIVLSSSSSAVNDGCTAMQCNMNTDELVCALIGLFLYSRLKTLDIIYVCIHVLLNLVYSRVRQAYVRFAKYLYK